MRRRLPIVVVAAVAAAGCGGSKRASPAPQTAPAASGGGGGGALVAETQSARTGDIPDTQAFLVFKDAAAGYSIKYPEGWSRQGSGGEVTFRAQNNVIHVSVAAGGPPTAATVAAELARARASQPTLAAGAPEPVQLPAGPAIKVSYSTQSAPNPVTGKRVKLLVDRYALARGGRRATIELGTPVGVDNHDAYAMISRSFSWR